MVHKRKSGILTALFACAMILSSEAAGKPSDKTLLKECGTWYSLSRQVLIVRGAKGKPHSAFMTYYEKNENRWKAVSSCRCAVGYKGIAESGEKIEGDGKTPSGIYRLGLAFGYDDSCDTKLEYKGTGPDDVWVDDPSSDQYNSWVTGRPASGSYEVLRRDDYLYKLAVVVEYNTHKPVKGRGSAIFMHIWESPDSPTSGCVATDEKNLRALLRRLDAGKRPLIVIVSPSGKVQ
jgi:L,D-peptidoglycan transpeptidase YkuD (ErfK/YbiS/YcfS/YnhG family)